MNGGLTGALYHTTYEFHQLVARNDTNSTAAAHPAAEKPPSYKFIGLTLAIVSGLFIGVSFVLKKMGLLKANVKYNEEAGEGYGYLKNVWWWTGMTLMILGEICNFAAYLFADAILVTPLGALSVVVCAILSSIFLKERLSFVGKIGCFNCIVGAVVIAANAPEQAAVSTIQEMKKMVVSPGFLTYAGIIIVGCIVVAVWVAPKYGKKSMMVYLTVCSLIGGLSVVSIQGIGAAITAQARGIPQFNQWFLYIVIVFVIATLVTEIIYLNKALNLYNAALVTPTYYVFFTSATIVSDAVLYRGFKGSALQIVTVVLGFLQICSGVVLLQLSKSAKDVPDTAVFTGDLDQMRTVAEQEEPEYEPRADTMRGTAALLRAVSTSRQKRETKEIVRLREEHMQPIGEDDQVEWDGLRRRRTLSSPGSRPLSRRKTIHPPLGMTHVPDDDTQEQDPDNGMHPGFWSHFKRKPVSEAVEMGHVPPSPSQGDRTTSPRPTSSNHSSFTFGLPRGLRSHSEHPSPGAPHIDTDIDTSYLGAGGAATSPSSGPHIHFSESVSEPHLSRPRPPSTVPASPDSLPHAGNKRQFSFTNMFHRNRSRSPLGSDARPRTPLARSALSFSRKGSSSAGVATEEERLGLVRGDTAGASESPPGYDSTENSPRDDIRPSDDDVPPGYVGGTVVRRQLARTEESSDEERDGGKEIEAASGRGRTGGGDV